MLHPHTELRYIGPEVGYGVFATHRIPRGTITWVQDKLDQVINPDAPGFAEYPPDLERYSFRNSQGHYVLCWDLARFVNHNCQPNCLSPGMDFEIAVRDIEVGEEVTNDYGSLNLEFEMDCHCGAPNCRGKTRPEDFERYALGWDQLLRVAFPEIASAEQPLWRWLAEPDFVRACLREGGKPPSIQRHYFTGGRARSIPA